MSTKTEILKLTKPAATDIVDISVINENMDIIDENSVSKVELDTIKKNLEDSDAALKSGYETADDAIKKEFREADATLRSGYESADESIRTDLHTTIEALRSGYESADESIRTDLHTTTERIDNLRVGGRNLLASRNIIKGVKIMTGVELGENSADSNYYAYNLIKAKEGDKFTLTFVDANMDKRFTDLGFFNSDKICMGRVGFSNQSTTVTAPADTAYISLSTENKNPHGCCKLERYSIPTDYTPAPEDIEDEVAKVNTKIDGLTASVSDLNTKVENKLSNCELILGASFSTSGIINIPVSKTYSFYTIILEGDDNNGITITIPKYVMDTHRTPFYLDVRDLINTGYSAKANGQIYSNNVDVRSVSLTGWTQVSVYVYGVY